MDYVILVITVLAIYGIGAVALNLAFGLGGIFVVTQAAFLGVGAYAAALLAKAAPAWGFWPGLLIAAAVAALLAWVIGIATLRIRGDAFIVASLALQIVLVDVFVNLKDVTGGPYGLSKLPEVLPNRVLYLLLTVAILAGVSLYAHRLTRSPMGRTLRAIRDDDSAAEMSGKDTVNTRVAVYMVTCALAAVAGGLMGILTKYIYPGSFGVDLSILMIAMIIVGGLGNVWGALLGALLLGGLPEALRFLPIPNDNVLTVQRILYGSALMLVPFWRPRGLFPDSYGRNARVLGTARERPVPSDGPGSDERALR